MNAKRFSKMNIKAAVDVVIVHLQLHGFRVVSCERAKSTESRYIVAELNGKRYRFRVSGHGSGYFDATNPVGSLVLRRPSSWKAFMAFLRFMRADSDFACMHGKQAVNSRHAKRTYPGHLIQSRPAASCKN